MSQRSPLWELTPQGTHRRILTMDGLWAIAGGLPQFDERGWALDRAYQIAVNVIDLFFGREWFEKHVRPRESTASDRVPHVNFLRTSIADERDENLHLLRVIWLAEMLFNFQRTPGLDGVLTNLQGGQIESGYAELEVGKLLSTYRIPFQFVVPEETPGGRNYDVEFFHPNGSVVAGETKCKVEGTNLRDETIKNTIQVARKKLPKDKPSYLFVKVPQDWMEAEEFRDRVSALARASFTTRPTSIVTYASIVRFDVATGEISHGLIGREIRNHKVDDSRDWRLLTVYDEDRPLAPPGWVSFPHLFPTLPVPAYRLRSFDAK